MTAGEVVCKVEIEEKCGSGVNAGGGTVDCNVGGNGNCNCNGNGGSACVFVNRSVEVSAGEFSDAGGVNVDGEVEQFKKEGLGVEEEGLTVDLLVSVTNGVVNRPVTVSVEEVKAVEDDENVENGSVVDSPVVLVCNGIIAQDVNGHLDNVSGEQEVDVASAEDVNVENGSTVDSPVVLVCNGIIAQDVNGHLDEVSGEQEVDVTSAEDVNIENGSAVDSPVVLVCNGVIAQDDHGHLDNVSREQEVDVMSAEDVNVENGSAVDSPVVLVCNGIIAQDVNGHLDNISAEQEVDVNSAEDVTVENGSVVDSPVVLVCNGIIAQDVNGHLDNISAEQEVDVNSAEDVTVKNGSVVDSPVVLVCNGVMAQDVNGHLDNVSGEQEVDVTSAEDVNVENGSAVDSPVVLVCNGIVAQDVNGHLDNISREQEVDVNSAEEVDVENGSAVVSPVVLVCNGVIAQDVNGHLDNVAGEQEVDVTSVEDVNVENGSAIDSPVVLVCNGIIAQDVNGHLDEVSEEQEVDVKSTEDVNVENGLVVDSPVVLVCNGVIAQDVNGHLDNVSGEQVVDVNSAEDVNAENGSAVDSPVVLVCNGIIAQDVKSTEDVDDTGSELTESTLYSVKSSQVTGSGLEYAIKPSDLTVDVSGKPYEDLGSQLTADEPESCGGPIKGQECKVSVDGSDSVGNLVDNQECPISFDELEPSAKHTEKVESNKVVVQLEEKSEDHQELFAIPSEVNVEVEPNHVCSVIKAETKKAEGTESRSGVESEENPDSGLVLPEEVDDLTIVEQKVETESHLGTENQSAEGVDCGTEIENVVVSDNEEKENEVKDAHVELVQNIVPGNSSAEDMDCENEIKNADFPDEEKESEVNDPSVGDRSTLSFSDTLVNHGAVIEFGSIGRHGTTLSIQNEEVVDMNSIQTDAIDVHDEEVEVLEYNFLVKIPRFEDENFRDQIRSALEVVEEKTGIRESIRVKLLKKRDMLMAFNDEYDLVKRDEIAARRAVKAKRQEIDSVQAIINRWKNAMSVEDIDARIFGVEYMIQHETIRLTDEKEFIREIKQLKSLRDQLASNMGTPEEIRHAIDTKDQNEERMKTLRKELESLKREVSKFEAVIEQLAIKYEETTYEERDLKRQLRVADVVRQKAYADLNSLKKLSYDKNKNFRQFKEDVTTAKTFLSKGDKDALHRLCANQVETFMEQWNNNDEFRQEYVSRCNANASRRQKVSDGPPVVPDDVASVLSSNVNSIPGEVKHMSVVLPVEQGKDVSFVESMNEDNHDTGKSIEKVSGQKNQELKNKGVAKPTNLGSGEVAKEAELAVVADLVENIPTKEEIELARKAEEEIAAKLKEQRRLEEKAKAIEAIERKKRNAEKAQQRAELRARKEAEQKEKEREKRLRKKEKKAGGGDGEEVAGSEGLNEATTKEIETVANKKKSQKPPAHFFSKQLKPKPVPPPLINKNKRRWQQLGRLALGVVGVLGVLFVFLLANFGLFYDFKSSRFTIAY
ncbi:hypothetical protein HanIR_Chr08g0354081 [Helianthus annuus]|nr:hypothetical protein HanIR_Chr08g0354081 [Helianthus annuus]